MIPWPSTTFRHSGLSPAMLPRAHTACRHWGREKEWERGKEGGRMERGRKGEGEEGRGEGGIGREIGGRKEEGGGKEKGREGEGEER